MKTEQRIWISGDTDTRNNHWSQSKVNKNIECEISNVKREQPAFYRELKKQGFKPANHIDDKTGKPFVGWSK